MDRLTSSITIHFAYREECGPMTHSIADFMWTSMDSHADDA